MLAIGRVLQRQHSLMCSCAVQLTVKTQKEVEKYEAQAGRDGTAARATCCCYPAACEGQAGGCRLMRCFPPPAVIAHALLGAAAGWP